MGTPSLDIVVKHVIRLMDGHEKAFQAFDADFQYITTQWEQDTAAIGRILRAHLFVEHFLTDFIQQRNPELGPLDEARISFAQKLALVGAGTAGMSYLIPGIRRLNSIRNRLAHTLSAEVTNDDTSVFLQIGIFRAMRDEKARRESRAVNADPIAVLEEFALHAGSTLQASASRNADVWSAALRAAQEECEAEPAT